MATEKSLFKEEKQALNRVFEKELLVLNKEILELDEMRKKIIEITDSNDSGRSVLQQKFLDNTAIALSRQYEGKVVNHLSSLRKVKRIEREIKFLHESLNKEGSHTFEKLGYNFNSASDKLNNADNLYYPAELKHRIRQLQERHPQIHLKTSIPEIREKTKVLPDIYREENALNRKFLHIRKKRLNHQITILKDLVEENKNSLQKLKSKIPKEYVEDKPRKQGEKRANQLLCKDYHVAFTNYVTNLSYLCQGIEELYRTRSYLAENLSKSTIDKSKYIDSSQTLKKLGYSQKWLKENYGFAINNYKNIVNTKFYQTYSVGEKRQKCDDVLQEMCKRSEKLIAETNLLNEVPMQAVNQQLIQNEGQYRPAADQVETIPKTRRMAKQENFDHLMLDTQNGQQMISRKASTSFYAVVNKATVKKNLHTEKNQVHKRDSQRSCDKNNQER